MPSAVPSDVRQRPPQPERRARRPQQDVVRAGGHRAHEREPDSATSLSPRPDRRRATPGPVLYDPAVIGVPRARSSVRAWKPPVPGVREVLHARFTRARLPAPHPRRLDAVHRRRRRDPLRPRPARARRRAVDGLDPAAARRPRRPAGAADGYRKRVIYLEPRSSARRSSVRAVDRPALVDGRAARRGLSALHDALGCVDDALEAETRLAFVAERIRGVRSASRGRPTAAPARASDLPRRSARTSTTTCSSPVTMAEAAADARRRPDPARPGVHAAFGIAPHAYVVARRLEARARPDPRRPAVGRRRRRGRLLRPGAPDPPLQAVPRRHARSVPRPLNCRRGRWPGRPAAPGYTPAVNHRASLVLLAVLGVGVFLAGLELMITAVALPSIVVDLADWTQLRRASWIVNGYLLVYVVDDAAGRPPRRPVGRATAVPGRRSSRSRSARFLAGRVPDARRADRRAARPGGRRRHPRPGRRRRPPRTSSGRRPAAGARRRSAR